MKGLDMDVSDTPDLHLTFAVSCGHCGNPVSITTRGRGMPTEQQVIVHCEPTDERKGCGRYYQVLVRMLPVRQPDSERQEHRRAAMAGASA